MVLLPLCFWYGYPDDEYFFLKIIDMSRKKYVRNEPSHRIYD
jgi:hypothetical protein